MCTLRVLLVAGLGLVASCGSAPPPEISGVVLHLDPRLEDGRASIEAVQVEAQIVREWVPAFLDDQATGLDPWVPRNATLHPLKNGAGVRFYLEEYNPAEQLTHVTLSYTETVDTARVDALEFEARLPTTGQAFLTWFNLDQKRVYMVNAAASPGRGTTRFELAGQPGWTGKVARLHLKPLDRGPQNYALHRIRMLNGGMQKGAESTPGLADVGLLGNKGNLRRTWVSEPEMELFATVDVMPRGAQLAVDVAIPRMPLGVKSLRMEVHGRRETGGWLDLDAVQADAEGLGWQTLAADLSEHAGQAMQLRFRAVREFVADAPDAEVQRSTRKVWWGAPRVESPVPAEERDPTGQTVRPHMILVTLDTLRRDFVGVYDGPVKTPQLDKLGRGGLVFEDAWSAANTTLPSHSSMLTGLDVPSHGVSSNRATLSKDVRTLAQALRARGYQTAAAVSTHHLQAGYSGLGRGFDRFLDVQSGATQNGNSTVREVEAWVREWNAVPRGPIFLWVHLFDPHAPYRPPGKFLAKYKKQVLAQGIEIPKRDVDPPTIPDIDWRDPGMFLENVSNAAHVDFLYGAGVAYTDELFGRLIHAVDAGPMGARTAWAVTADHGESLGSHGSWYDHVGIYPQTMRVPLLLRVPGGPTGSVPARVSNLELARTLLDLSVGGPVEAGPEGELPTVGTNLLELHRSVERDGPGEPRPVHFVEVNDQSVGRVEGSHYTIVGTKGKRSPVPLYFDYSADPDCFTDLATERPKVAVRYYNRTLEWLEKRSTGIRTEAKVSAEQEARLQALGYGGDD